MAVGRIGKGTGSLAATFRMLAAPSALGSTTPSAPLTHGRSSASRPLPCPLTRTSRRTGHGWAKKAAIGSLACALRERLAQDQTLPLMPGGGFTGHRTALEVGHSSAISVGARR